MIAFVDIDKENDILYLALTPSRQGGQRGIVHRSERVGDSIVLDFDNRGQLIGLELMEASSFLNVQDLNCITQDAFLGVKEAAEFVGVEKSNFVRDYADKPNFPRPIIEVASGRIWLRRDVKEYLGQRGKRQNEMKVAREASSNMGIRPDDASKLIGTDSPVDKAKHILSISKTLKGYAIGVPVIARFLSATLLAGRAGLLASALRWHRKLSPKRFTVFCANQGLSPLEMTAVTQWLEKSGLISVEKAHGEIISYTNTILAYEDILTAVAQFFESLKPTKEERACIDLLKLVSDIPRSIVEAKADLADFYDEETADIALSIASGLKLVQERSAKGLKEPILFSPRIWASHINNIAQFLSGIDRTQRELVVELVRRIREYQGYPYEPLCTFAKKEDAYDLLHMCINVGLVSCTAIRTADGQNKSFLTSPHFLSEVSEQHGEDVCDRVKIFLDSIRNGQHYGRPETGRIFDPTLLLRRLLERGRIGPCTAIGKDYVVPEKEGIVKVTKASQKSGQAFMELVQKDTVDLVYRVVSRKLLGEGEQMRPENVRDEINFLHDEQLRVSLPELPGPMAEAERHLLLAIRE